MILDGLHIENGLTPAHPLLGATTLGALSAVSFRMVAVYALAACAAAGVSHDVFDTVDADGQQKPHLVQFTPHWTGGPTVAQVQALASAMAATVGVDVEWSQPSPPQ